MRTINKIRNNILLQLIVLIVMISFFTYCVSDKTNSSINTIEVDNHVDSVILSEVFDSSTMIVANLGDSYVSGISDIISVSNKLFLFDEWQDVVLILNSLGEIQCKIDNKGAGPYEYAQINNIHVVPSTETVYVMDNVQQKMIGFNFEGKAIFETRFKFTIDDFRKTEDGFLCFCEDDVSVLPNGEIVESGLFLVTDSGVFQEHLYQIGSPETISINYDHHLFELEGTLLLRSWVCDTIMTITSKGLEPYCWYDFKDKNLPAKYKKFDRNDVTFRDIVTSGYVFGMEPYFENSNYVYFKYHEESDFCNFFYNKTDGSKIKSKIVYNDYFNNQLGFYPVGVGPEYLISAHWVESFVDSEHGSEPVSAIVIQYLY